MTRAYVALDEPDCGYWSWFADHQAGLGRHPHRQLRTDGAFFHEVLGLRLELEQPGFWMLKLPDGSKVEVFGPDSDVNRHFTTGPVAGFLVDDIHAAIAQLRSAGVEILYESGSTTAATPGSTSAPRTGNICEFTQDPGVSRPH